MCKVENLVCRKEVQKKSLDYVYPYWIVIISKVKENAD